MVPLFGNMPFFFMRPPRSELRVKVAPFRQTPSRIRREERRWE